MLCASIRKSAKNHAAIKAAGAISPLVALLEDEWPSDSTKVHAATVLTELWHRNHNRRDAIDESAIRPLVMLLQSENDSVDKVAAVATMALRSLAYGGMSFTAHGVREMRDSIAAAGAIPALVDVVKNGSDRSKKHAASALWTLAVHHEGNKALIAASAIVPLVQLLRDGSDDAKKAAARTLSQLAVDVVDAENRVAIAAAGAIPLLVAAETGSHAGAKKWATAMLVALGIKNEDNEVAIAEARGIEALVQIARRGKIEFTFRSVISYLPSAGARERVARLLAARRGVIIRKILEAALPAEIAASVVAPFLDHWCSS